MTATFPHGYHVTLSWPGHGGAVLDATGGPPIEGGAPSEFGGRDTFEALARSSRSTSRW